MAVGDIFRLDYEMISDDRRVSVSQYYRETTIRTGTQIEVTGVICLLSEILFWTDFWQDFASVELVFDNTRCQQVFPTRQAPFISTVKQATAGEDLGDAMNGTTTTLVAQYGLEWSRNFQGRMYLPGLPEDKASQGRILDTPHAAIQASNDTFQHAVITPGAPAGGTYTPAVYSPTLAGADPLVLPVSSLMGPTPVRPRIATQRRRRTNVQTTS